MNNLALKLMTLGSGRTGNLGIVITQKNYEFIIPVTPVSPVVKCLLEKAHYIL